MESDPLSGTTFTIARDSQVSALVRFVLAELGASVVSVPPGEAADVAGAGDAPASDAVRISGYGLRGRFVDAPDHVAAIHAVGGAAMAQWTY